MDAKDPMDPPVPQPQPIPILDVWGLPVPPLPSWLPPADPDDSLGFCTGQDPEDSY